MADIKKTLSEQIENQFPEIYREDGPILVDFITAYFEYMESSDNQSTTLSRNMFINRDIDTTIDDFTVHFKEKYLNNFPYVKTVDNRFAVKHIMDYYRSKGTPNATELLMRMLFNSDSEVYYPMKDVFKASDSIWKIPSYLEVTQSPVTKDFVNKMITGTISGATGFVEGIITKRIQGRMIDVVYLSQVKGTFQTNELISANSSFENVPKIIGSLSSLDIINGGQNNIIGDIFYINDDTGKQGKARVTAIENATGRVSFTIIDGGSGYSLNTLYDNDPSNDYTDVYVATAMIQVDNANTSNPLVQYEKLKQEREIVTLLSATDVNEQYANTFSGGDYLLGVRTYTESYTANGTGNSFLRSNITEANDVFVVVTNTSVTNYIVDSSEYTSNSSYVNFFVDPEANSIIKVIEYNVVANGIIASIANTGSSNDIITTASANSYSTLVLSSGTFANQISIDFANAAPFSNGEILQEESTVVLSINSVSGTFSNNDIVEMRVYGDPSDIGNTSLISSYAYGTVIASSPTELTLKPAWGTFSQGSDIVIYASNGSELSTATITGASITQIGASGILTAKSDSNTWVLHVSNGNFDANNMVRGFSTKIEERINSIRLIGASEVWYNGNNAANGIVDTVTNNTVTGILVGQNTTYIGLYGNTSAFSYIANGGMMISTSREDNLLIDLESNPNRELTILNIGTGSSATFQPGSLENEETVNLNFDLLNANNVAGIPFLNVALDGSNSGVGFVDSISIVNGGSGYVNGSSATFTNGGYANGNPTVSAYGEISTDGSGGITDITILVPGEGYFSEPTIILPSTVGSEANVSINMDYGYGFIKNPNGDANTPLQDILTFADLTIGTISSLTQVNPGSDYNINPFVSVYNRYTSSYNRRNLILFITLLSGSFKIGEIVTQDGNQIGTVETYSLSENKLVLKRTVFNVSFSSSQIIGSTSGATALIDNFDQDFMSKEMGNNANVSSTVIVANGVATAVEIKNSGYGYLANTLVTLISANANQIYTITANTHIETQGIGEGHWISKSSHASDTSKLHDNKYYQAYSYDIQSDISINRYRDIVKKVLHVAGAELFGTVVKTSKNNSLTTIVETEISTE